MRVDGWVFAALCSWANRSEGKLVCGKRGNTITIYDENLEPIGFVTVGSDLPHDTRRMLQALDAYWLHCDGLPKGRYPRSGANDETWWGRFERYRAQVERHL